MPDYKRDMSGPNVISFVCTLSSFCNQLPRAQPQIIYLLRWNKLFIFYFVLLCTFHSSLLCCSCFYCSLCLVLRVRVCVLFLVLLSVAVFVLVRVLLCNLVIVKTDPRFQLDSLAGA